MKTHSWIKVVLLFSCLAFANNLGAQTLNTNIEGLVIKNYECLGSVFVKGILANRNPQQFNGQLRVKIIDLENDILWQGIQKIDVGPQNGVSFQVQLGAGKCGAPNKVQITLER